MKILEYGQRLFSRGRNVLAEGEGSTGRALLRAALSGGAQALGAPAPELATGASADLVVLRDTVGLRAEGDRILDRWIFGADVAVDQVWVGGARVVSGGRHRDHDRIAGAYAKVLAGLVDG